jgi:hypothetical protein
VKIHFDPTFALFAPKANALNSPERNGSSSAHAQACLFAFAALSS